MRHLGGYTWEILLSELVPRTMVSYELLKKEKEAEKKSIDKAKRKKR